MDSITNHIVLTRERQIELGMLNQRDMYLIESNLSWIDRWAMIHIFLMISCAVFQTYFIKRLFQSSSSMKRMRT